MTDRAKSIVKILTIVAIIALVASFVFVACNKDAKGDSKTVTLIIGVGESYVTLTETTDNEYMAGLLLELKEAGKIQYEWENGSYGTYMLSLNNINPQGQSEWVAVYHDIDDVTLRADIGEWPMPNAEYNGKTYYSSSAGVDLLPLIDGHTYYFTLGTY